MTTKTKTALDELAERRTAVEAAAERVAELEKEERSSKRELDRAISPLQDYYRSLEAGEREPDAETEKRLRREAKAAQAEVAPQAVYNPRAEHGSGMRVEMVNLRLAGQLEGARERLEAAEQELRLFLSERFEDLVVELAAKGKALSERYEPLIEQAQKAQAEWQQLRAEWRPIVGMASFGWGDFPSSPFAEVAREVPALMPRQLVEGESLGRPTVPEQPSTLWPRPGRRR